MRTSDLRCFKTCIGSLLFLCLCLEAWATPQTEPQAAQVVAGWLAATPTPLGAAAVLKASAKPAQAFQSTAGQTLYYVFPLEPAGFVVTSADDGVEPILAFSATGSFDSSGENPLVALLAHDLPTRLSQAGEGARGAGHTGSVAQKKWASLARTGPKPMVPEPMDDNGISAVDDLRVAPFTQSQWNQSVIWNGSSYVACYNYHTPPFDAGDAGNYVCGCDPTAWAQIMRYFSYPTQSVGTASYPITVDGVVTSRALRGGDGLGGPYQWNLMPATPGAATTPQQCEAIGALTGDIGTASGTSYGGSGSSTTLGTNLALKSVFDYANAIGAGIMDGYFTDSVLPSLDARLPVFFALAGLPIGHSVVGDGYGYNLGTLYHHLNMGWGGEDNVWYNFDLPSINAQGQQFGSVQVYYYNIFPTGGGEIVSGRVLNTANSPISNALVQATGGGKTYSALTDGLGVYALAQLPSSTTFSMSVTNYGYRFSPRTVTTGFSQDDLPTGNQWGVNFVGATNPATWVVSGTISSSANTSIGGVTVAFSNGGGTVTTDGSGFFINQVPSGWTGTLTPSLTQYVFVQAVLAYTNVTTDLPNQNVIGSLILYVNASASGLNNGSSWANAFTNLQTAISQAGLGDEIWVAQGVYYPGTNPTNSFQCPAWASLLGGFAGGETLPSQRNWNAHPTVLSGDIGAPGDNSDNVYNVVQGASQAVLDGFTVTGGNANGTEPFAGGGVYNPANGVFPAQIVPPLSFTVANCLITGNYSGVSGGGVYNAIVTNSVISSNYSSYGGGMNYGMVVNSVISGNSASQMGGGVDDATVINSVISSNSAPQGGGIAWANATNCTISSNNAATLGGGAAAAFLANCVVSNNSASSGGGGFGCTNVNCTFVGNSAQGGGGVYGGSVVNSLISGNSASQTGGGVCCNTGEAMPVVNSVISGNSALNGGAIANANATNCTISGNDATQSGGGGYGACLANCVVTNNSASYGGGAYECTNVNCTLAGNLAAYYGGGGYMGDNLNCTFAGNSGTYFGGGDCGSTNANCTFVGNNSQNGGGAAYSFLTTCVVTNNSAISQGGGVCQGTNLNCTIVGNWATGAEGEGGGVCDGIVVNSVVCSNAATQGGGVFGAAAVNSVISSNAAAQGGGLARGTATNCVLSRNNASQYGGGAAYAILANCLFTNNSAAYGGGTFQGANFNCAIASNSATSQGGGDFGSTNLNCTIVTNSAQNGGGLYSSGATNCIIMANRDSAGDSNYWQGTLDHCCTTPLPTSGSRNFTNNPLFVNQAAGNFRLLTNSPCVNAGTNQSWMTGATDLDGHPRIIGGVVDLGAYESTNGATTNGIPWGWLVRYGLATDGSADLVDSDGSGFNNLQDYIADTNPTNAASYFHITCVSNLPPLTVYFQSSPNRLYSLYSRTNLSSGAWAPVSSQTNISGNGGADSLQDTNTAHAQRFYRVGVQLP